jgi:hypothetical protein
VKISGIQYHLDWVLYRIEQDLDNSGKVYVVEFGSMDKTYSGFSG